MLTKQRIFEIINKADEGDKASRLFDGIIMSLICLSIVSIVLESFSSLAQNYRLLFRIFEGVSVAIFTIEYICRIWTADLLYPNEKHPRLKYVTSFMAIIDPGVTADGIMTKMGL